jgi:hypothetical protein
MLNASATQVAETSVVGSTSGTDDSAFEVFPSAALRFGCCAMMATLRSEFFAVDVRVGFRFVAAGASCDA